jgi:hypothetical protein
MIPKRLTEQRRSGFDGSFSEKFSKIRAGCDAHIDTPDVVFLAERRGSRGAV